jgi:hypothetical protein
MRFSLKTPNKLFIIKKKDKFYEINIYCENFPSFVRYDDNKIIESMIVEQLSGKNIINLSYGFIHYIAWNDKMKYFVGVIIVVVNSEMGNEMKEKFQ